MSKASEAASEAASSSAPFVTIKFPGPKEGSKITSDQHKIVDVTIGNVNRLSKTIYDLRQTILNLQSTQTLTQAQQTEQAQSAQKQMEDLQTRFNALQEQITEFVSIYDSINAQAANIGLDPASSSASSAAPGYKYLKYKNKYLKLKYN